MIVGRWYVQLDAIWHWYSVLASCALLSGVILKGLPLRKFVSDGCIYNIQYVCFIFAK